MFRGELRTIRTTRTALGLWLGAIVVVAVGAFSTVSSMPARDLTAPVRDQPYFFVASVNLSLFALLIGVRSFTDEFRYGTISWKVLASNARWKIVASKSAVAAGAAGLMAFTAQLVGLAVASTTASGKGAAIAVGAGDAAAGAGLTVAIALWAVLGVAIGALIRHQVAAVVAVLVWVLAIENLGDALLGTAGRFLPGRAAHALAQAGAAGDVLPAAGGGALLSLYAVVAIAAAIVTLERRPVPPAS